MYYAKFNQKTGKKHEILFQSMYKKIGKHNLRKTFNDIEQALAEDKTIN